MKDTCILIGFFMLGIGGGLCGMIPEEYLTTSLEMGTLYALIFLVGMGMGSDGKFLHNILNVGKKDLIVPIAVVVGSLAGGSLISLALADIDVIAGAAVGAGFGYYSLSSVLLSQLRGDELGTIALVANIVREVTTILAAPVMVRLVGPLGPIASGGATTMDTTLPIIVKYSGKAYAMTSVINGIVLTCLVPVLVPFILALRLPF
ncbi:lysine exporter LysO family protein [Desulfoplanes formicivorans]|uniref:Membrane protein n=1 Tax=Desulfoplanes formicivorans TaxID=1592317 RepID=A0A194AI77_9BACT|nr:lysine exporter LysO family protein [Desulfoplanes formicivorans]GAU08464.1 membrane protein [Desulfoplanes formicivorans]